MAKGIVAVASSDIGVGITGIAGPTGGTAEKPVGLVYFSVCYDGKLVTKELRLNGNRDEIREQTTKEVVECIYSLLG